VSSLSTGASASPTLLYVKGASGSPMMPTASLEDPAATASDVFGSSVSVSGTAAVVGAREQSQALVARGACIYKA